MDDLSLPAAMRMGRVRLSVADLGRALAFYEGVLGLHVAAQEGGEAVLAASEGGPALVRLHERPAASARQPRAPGLFHLALLVPDRRALARALRRLAQKHWPLHGASDHLVSEALYLADPDGHGIEIYADRPRHAWSRHEGEVRMTTLPLDLEGLLRETDTHAADAAGLPPGTAMGHVHLRVSSLEAAEAFYHGLLGFDVTARSYRGALFLAAGGYHHHLGVNVWGLPYTPAAPDAPGLLDFQIVLPADTLPTLVERLRASGATPEPSADGWRLLDPDGLAVVVTGTP